MTDFLIDVIVDPSKSGPALDKVDSRLQKLEKSGKRLQSTLRRAITLVGLTAAARQLGIFADSLTNVQNRIRLVTKDTAQLNAVTKKLFDISARTRTGFAATATIFSRTALAVKDLGLSLQETLDFTEALNQAIVLSGVKAQEANAGLIQLSQGLASGTLRGDELRSVLEQLPKVADLIAGELGVLRGELRILGEQGKITTADIIKAFTGVAAADLTKAFAESIPTMSQGFSVLTTRVIEFVGEVDKVRGISTTVARGLIILSDNLDNVAKAAIVAGAALAGPFAKAGVLFAAGAVRALTLAIVANPIGALVVLILTAATAILQFGDSIAVSADGLVSLKDVALATWQFMVEGIEPLLTFIKDGFKDAVNFVIGAFGTLNVSLSDVLSFAKVFVNRFIGFFFGLNRAIASIFKDLKAIFSNVLGSDLTDLISSVFEFVGKGLKIITNAATIVLSELKSITAEITKALPDADPTDKSFTGTFLTVGKNAKNAFVEGFNQDFVGDIAATIAPGLKKISESAKQISSARRNVTPEGDGGDNGIGDKGVKKDVLPFALKNQIRLLQEEGKTLRETNRERGIQNELLELEEKLRASNVTLNDTTRALLETEVRRITVLREQADVLDDLKGPQEELATRQEALNALYQTGAINLQQFQNEMKQLNLAQVELNASQGTGGFVDGFLDGISTMLESVRSFATEAGELFAGFFTQSTDGFAEAISNAVVFGDSIKEGLGNAARGALASLLSGLLQLGIQFAVNAATGNALAASTTAVGVAQAATLSAAFAAPAALVSLATSGANSAPASAGISTTVALAQALSTPKGFADGGFVTGPGSSRSDSIPAMLSNKEFVVNAKATARFRPQLEAINNDSSGAVPSSEQSGTGTNNQGSPSQSGGGVRIVNVIDPSLVADFMTSSEGDQVIVNTIERNAGSINQVLRNN